VHLIVYWIDIRISGWLNRVEPPFLIVTPLPGWRAYFYMEYLSTSIVSASPPRSSVPSLSFCTLAPVWLAPEAKVWDALVEPPKQINTYPSAWKITMLKTGTSSATGQFSLAILPEGIYLIISHKLLKVCRICCLIYLIITIHMFLVWVQVILEGCHVLPVEQCGQAVGKLWKKSLVTVG
jgi:hypothetical protein